MFWYCREQVSERGILDNSEVHKVQELNYMSSFIIWLQEIVAFDFRFNLNDRQTQHFTSELNKEKKNSCVKNLGKECVLIDREIFF